MSDRRQLDPEALGDHADRLYRAAWTLCGSRQEAEDLVQETFLRVLGKPRLLNSAEDLGYLLRALRNTFFSQRRAEARRPRTAPMSEEAALLEDLTAGSLNAKLESAELFAAISRLPDHFRHALVAVDVVGLSYGEAAVALKVCNGTVTSRLHRARQRVARELIGGAPA